MKWQIFLTISGRISESHLENGHHVLIDFQLNMKCGSSIWEFMMNFWLDSLFTSVCSIWTVDLAYLLQRFSVTFSYFTVTFGANPNYCVESFYKVINCLTKIVTSTLSLFSISKPWTWSLGEFWNINLVMKSWFLVIKSVTWVFYAAKLWFEVWRVYRCNNF